jgi:NAD(P)H-dependent flavin oxidoreductase YrpB (nitropropane dioxygenase family)
MRMSSPFERLNLTVPIFQAPIGGIESPELAAPTSNAGGAAGMVRSVQSAGEIVRELAEGFSVTSGVAKTR